MKNKRYKQQGFTIIELMVVVIGLGLLIKWAVPKFAGVEDSAKAKILVSTASDIRNLLDQVGIACQVSATAVGSVLPDTGKTIQDVIFGGVDNVASNYKICFNDSKVKALVDVSQPSGSAGAYNVQGSAVNLTGGGSTKLLVKYLAVPNQIARDMAKQFNPKLDELDTSDTTSSVLRYDSSVNDARDVTVLR